MNATRHGPLRGRWLSDHQAATGEPAAVVYSMPAIGSSPAAHEWIARHTPAWLQVFSLRLPGRENRYTEPPLTHMSEVVRDFADRLAAHAGALGKPFLLLGECAGAYGAYEIGRTLQTMGIVPSSLVVLRQTGPAARANARRLHTLPSGPLRLALSEADLVPADLTADAAMFTFFEPMLRADLRIVETYEWAGGDLPSFPISVLPPRPDPACEREVLAAWARVTTGEVTALSPPPGPARDEHAAVGAELARLLPAPPAPSPNHPKPSP